MVRPRSGESSSAQAGAELMAVTEHDLAEYVHSLLADLRKMVEPNRRFAELARLISAAEHEADVLAKVLGSRKG